MDGNLQMRATFANHEKIRSSSFGSVSTKSQKCLKISSSFGTKEREMILRGA